jgi:hypothetical protein
MELGRRVSFQRGFQPAARQEPRENDKFFEYLWRPMLFCLIGTTIIVGAITGFVDFSEGAFFRGLGRQIVHGMLSIACLTLVGAAFWRFGWKIGLFDLLLVFIASHVGVRLHSYFRKSAGL